VTVQTQDPVLRRLFLGHQQQLRAALGADREAIDHPGLKGGASEEHWRTVLATYLPRRYRVTTGVVVDWSGGQSHQIDIIIHDAHFCPRFLDHGGTSFVPAESVYAVLEAKQTVNAGYLGAAAEKAESVRRLRRTSAPIVERGEKRSARDLPPILAGVVALASDWAGGLGRAFQDHLASHTGDRALDIGCALHAGAFEVPEGQGPDQVEVFAAETALVMFFLALVRRLQRLGTVPAIDWSMYEQSFRGEG
jgi:hypothetical protein